MRRRLLTTLLAVLAVSTMGTAGAPVPAAASLPLDVHIGAMPEYYLPSTVSIRPGGTVTWDFTSSHTATDDTPLALYDSGIINHTSYAITFVASGSYPFVCTIHAGMDGRVDVPVTAKPSKGHTGTTFTIVWASVTAPNGYVYDVQRRRNDGPWKSWRTATTARNGIFVPHNKGTTRFRARLRLDGNTDASGWSPAAKITVT